MDEKTKKRDGMILSEAVLLGQLEMLHNRWGVIFQYRGSVRNWCILLYSGALIAYISNTFPHRIVYFILSLMILVVFFILEVLYGADLVIHEKQMEELETRIAEKNLSLGSSSDVFAISGYKKLMNDRLKELGWWGFQIERCCDVMQHQKNIPIFYGILFGLSIIASLVFSR
jgi:hypothetical protein